MIYLQSYLHYKATISHLVYEDYCGLLAVIGESPIEHLLRLVRTQLPVRERLQDTDIRLLRLGQPQAVHFHKLCQQQSLGTEEIFDSRVEKNEWKWQWIGLSM